MIIIKDVKFYFYKNEIYKKINPRFHRLLQMMLEL